MFNLFEKAVLSMAMLRFLSGSLEITAAVLILKVNQVDKALMINSSLALIGPLIFIATTTIGLVGIAEKISFTKLIWISLGIGCILYGIKSS